MSTQLLLLHKWRVQSHFLVFQLLRRMAGFPPDLEMSRTLVAVLAALVLLCICLAAQFEGVDLLPLFAQGLVHAAQVVAHHA